MRKKVSLIFSLLLFVTVSAQVGVNTTDPKATFDVTGSPTDLAKTDGIIVPKITGNQLFQKNNLYGTDQTGALIYVTNPASGTSLAGDTIDVIERGFYIHNGTKWVWLSTNPWKLSGNIATATDFIGTINNAPLNLKIAGENAGKITSSSTSYGYHTLLSNTGIFNSAFGVNSLRDNTTGVSNSAFGYNALYFNTTGSGNSAFGNDVLTSNTIGGGNVAIGSYSLNKNTTGNNNIGIGTDALHDNAEGFENIAIGRSALQHNTTITLSGSNNIGIGTNALQQNTTGYNNIGIGTSALIDNDTGKYNVAIGWTAGPNGNNFKNLTNTTSIGAGARVEASNSIVLGGSGALEVNVGINTRAPQAKLHIVKNPSQLTPAIIDGCNVYNDNAAAVAAGLPVGALYRTGDVLKVVH